MSARKNGRVTDIFYYPIKSCRGIATSQAEIGERGIVNDRRWVIANPQGKAVTQRDIPQMALVQAIVDASGALVLNAPDRSACFVATANSPTRMVDVWGNQCRGIDEGDEAANWLSSYLNTSCRLVRVAEDNDRLCRANLPDGASVKLTFVDGYSFLVISEESLDDLNKRLSEPISIIRFRPNIVISGLGAFAEDECQQLQIGKMMLHKIKPCERCVITTIDPQSTFKGPEPLKTLNSYRRIENKVIFGTYFLHSRPGTIAVGDEVAAS